MIVSIDKEESQICPVYDIKVVFNGKIQTKCVYADDENAFIDRYSVDYKGDIHYLPYLYSGTIIERRFGNVQILHGDK